MRLIKLELNRFRNYRHETISFDDGVNIFFGNNGEGKTNVLEAVYMLSLGRSFRTSKDKDMINLDSESLYVRALVESFGKEYKIEYKIDSKIKKAIKINGLPIERISELLGIINVVIFSPEDLSLVKEGPKERRNFMDRELSQLRPRYYGLLSDYYKNLSQRNNLLKNKGIDPILLDVYDDQLANYGSQLIKFRQEFVNKISLIADKNHYKISSGKENLTVAYERSIDADNKEDYLDELKSYRDRDIQRGTTSKGIHRDDLKIEINGIDLRTYGSQGQKRSAAISLKLSEIELIHEMKGQYPIVLLDDIFSELDKDRQIMLLDSIRHTQTLVTTAEDIDIPLKTVKFHVEKGSTKKIYYKLDV